jgi:hypothetical protein
MDFQFTSRPNVDVVPVWKTPATPLKRERAFHGYTRTEPTAETPCLPCLPLLAPQFPVCMHRYTH